MNEDQACNEQASNEKQKNHYLKSVVSDNSANTILDAPTESQVTSDQGTVMGGKTSIASTVFDNPTESAVKTHVQSKSEVPTMTENLTNFRRSAVLSNGTNELKASVVSADIQRNSSPMKPLKPINIDIPETSEQDSPNKGKKKNRASAIG